MLQYRGVKRYTFVVLLLVFGLGRQFAVARRFSQCCFLLPVFVISALGVNYGLRYWKQAEHPGEKRPLNGVVLWGMAGSMALVTIAAMRSFSDCWEIMALPLIAAKPR